MYLCFSKCRQEIILLNKIKRGKKLEEIYRFKVLSENLLGYLWLRYSVVGVSQTTGDTKLWYYFEIKKLPVCVVTNSRNTNTCTFCLENNAAGECCKLIYCICANYPFTIAVYYYTPMGSLPALYSDTHIFFF